MDSDKGLVPDLNLDRLSVVKGPKNKMKRKRNVSVSGASDGKKNKTRARNFTEDETVVVMEEGKKSRRLLKGRFGPSVTNDLKEERWQQIADNVNQLNGKNDRTWESVRKKFHDVMSSARCKGRTQVREMKKNWWRAEHCASNEQGRGYDHRIDPRFGYQWSCMWVRQQQLE